jgi:hypothetical protein
MALGSRGDVVVSTPTPVAYGPFKPQDGARRGIDYWIRRFYCPDSACAERRGMKRQILGSQTVRAAYDPEAGYAVSGYFVERVEVVHRLIDLGLLADGTLSIGLTNRARKGTGSPASLHRVQTTEPAFIGRHDPRRDPLPSRLWSLVPRAVGRASVITCPSCRRRYVLDGNFSAEELHGA